jgi:hypothetical protein
MLGVEDYLMHIDFLRFTPGLPNKIQAQKRREAPCSCSSQHERVPATQMPVALLGSSRCYGQEIQGGELHFRKTYVMCTWTGGLNTPKYLVRMTAHTPALNGTARLPM